ncbi:polysaccharide deacetylase family protein [Streptomyces sp. NPDC057199]|uniref:polysaccharide deacetylase family protein n=1 Tax=Streptomyces sp. NPDC057199 TaxID=3346047 RepID=UPI00362782D9
MTESKTAALTNSNPHYDYSAIVDRQVPPLPGGARVAVWVGVNVEYYPYGRPALSLAPFTAELEPDPTNYGWRDYGPRVGIWRLAEVLEGAGIPFTAITNADVLERYPRIAEEGARRGWAWVAHGTDNATWHVGMERAAEVELISGIADRFGKAVGVRPKGWLGPVLTTTSNTTSVLAELGFDYSLDWQVDDLPFDLSVPTGRLLSVPYSSEVNDIPLTFLHHQSARGMHDAIVDHFDQIHAEGGGRVLGIGLHPFLAGQPHRAGHLRRALDHIAGHDDVWLTTSDELASWYLRTTHP